MNLDVEETEKFSAMADRWWDPEGPMRLLHRLNPIRSDYVVKSLRGKTGSILDVGAGGGLLSLALAEQGLRVTALEPNASLVEVGRREAERRGLNLTWFCGTLESFLETSPPSFDAIACLELLEHVPQPQSLVENCSLLLRPEGKLFVSTLDRTLRSYCETILLAEYILRWLPRGTHDYLKFIRPSELVRMARAGGLELGDLKGLTYHFTRQTFELTRHPQSNYLAMFSKTS